LKKEVNMGREPIFADSEVDVSIGGDRQNDHCASTSWCVAIVLGRRVVSVRPIGRLALVLAGVTACARAAPQLVVVLDTDAPVIGDLSADAGQGAYSFAAAVDWVRVDVVADDGSLGKEYEFPVTDDRNWPLSLGVAGPGTNASSLAHLRIRAFGAAFSTPSEQDGRATRDPIPEIAIDRLVDIPFPSSGVSVWRVLLAGDCMGRPASLDPSHFTTCVDGSMLHALARAGVAVDDGAPSHVGQWHRARAVDCPAGNPPPDAGRICIPGGMSILGDPTLRGDSNGSTILESTPLVPVIVSPFLLDQTEMTVGAYRALRASGIVGGSDPSSYDPSAPTNAWAKYCTWNPSDTSHDALPLNCIDWTSARAICQALGGDLPTEAQWEHAARGRGRQDPYPWGNEPPVTAAGAPACDLASYSRASLPNSPPPQCPFDSAIEPVGSHPADKSRDGVFDLAGSLSEMVLDTSHSYDDACGGGPGLRDNPKCVDSSSTLPSFHVLRGGSFLAPSFFLQAAVRQTESALAAGPFPAFGFRCAYPAETR
jgi:formylglycine-generating enzyme required for sulfatase activity